MAKKTKRKHMAGKVMYQLAQTLLASIMAVDLYNSNITRNLLNLQLIFIADLFSFRKRFI